MSDDKNKNPENRNPSWFPPGVSGNPGGRPSDAKFRKLLLELFGEDGKELLYILIAQMYGVDIFNTGIDKEIKKILPKIDKKDWRNRLKQVDKKLQTDNAKWLLERMFGKALQKIESDIRGDITTRNMKVEFIDSEEEDESPGSEEV